MSLGLFFRFDVFDLDSVGLLNFNDLVVVLVVARAAGNTEIKLFFFRQTSISNEINISSQETLVLSKKP
jgi:hypothetical protein